TTFGIMLGVAVILAIRVANQSTLDSLTSLFTETSGNADLVIINPDNDEGGYYEDVLRRIAHFPGVAIAVPSVQAQTVLVDSISPDELEMSFLGASTRQLILFGIDPILDPLAREYNLVAGGFLSENVNALDVVLVQEFAEDQDVWLKDRIDIVTPEGFETLRIIGIISKDGAGTLNNGAFGVIPLKVAQKIFDSAGKIDQIDIVAAEGSESGLELDALKQALQDRLGKKYSVVYPATQGKKVTQMLGAYQVGLSFFSIIALFVGTFLIYNAFSMTVVERTREIGMMRTLGMTRSQIMRQILTEAVILGIFGSAIGVGVGILMSRGLIRMMEVLVGSEVKDISVPLDGLVMSVVVGIIVTLVAALLPARAAGNVSPLEALRVRGNPREGWIVRRGWILGLIMVFMSFLILNFNPFPQDFQEQASMSTIFFLFI
ncbi:MAG: ABC transporter permease, partial [Anaerolineales bacterium]|nr:ABC transporter permease [Anaerolineales bacterium]